MPFPFQYKVIATPTTTTHVTPSLLLLPLLLCVVFAANAASATISSTTTSTTPSTPSPENETREQHALNIDTPPSTSSLATSLFSKEEPYVFRWIKSLLEDMNSKIGENGWTKYVVNSLTPTPKMKRLLAAVGYMLVDMLPVAFILWYSRLLLGSPEVDGSQFRENIVNFLKRNVFPSYEAFFHLNIALDTGSSSNKNVFPSTLASPFTDPPATNDEQQHQEEKEEDLTVQPDTQYFFAYHPHGILPNTIAWLHHSTTWERIVKIRGSSIVSFGASIIFNTPFLRDLALTCGSREVSKHAIETAIRQGKSPLLVPGGQSEMIHSWPSKNVLHIVTYHHGFVRLAMKHRIPLVPIMCYGEHNVYYNVYLPKLQYWFLKRVGFGFPVLPIGWRFLPLPGRCPLNVVVGVPMNTEKIGERTLDFNNPDDVAECAELYFTHLSELFYRHREVSGYPNMQLVYHGDKRNPMKGTPQPPPSSSLEKEDYDDSTLLSLRKRKERKAESTSKRNSQTTKEVSSATNAKKNKSKKK